MNSEDAQARIALRVHIDLLIDVLDAPDEEGVVWCETDPYDVVLPDDVPAWRATEKAEDNGWVLQAALISVGVGLLTSVVILLILAWSIYAAMGVLLWLMVSSVS